MSDDRSLDDLVGAAEYRQRNCQTERLCGLQIDDQLKFGRLLDWQVARLFALEDAADIDSGLVVRKIDAGSVAHKATSRDEFAKWVDRWHSKTGCQRDKLIATPVKYNFVCHDERTDPLFYQRTSVKKTPSNSAALPAVRIRTCRPIARAASSTFATSLAKFGLFGL